MISKQCQKILIQLIHSIFHIGLFYVNIYRKNLDIKLNVEEIFIGYYDFKSKSANSVRNSFSTSADRTVLIFFLGSCTYTKITVLKKLALKKKPEMRLVH